MVCRNIRHILIADIQNAVLNLPNGEEFQANNPVERIASITVTQLDNKVQVRITGETTAPTVNFASGDRRLVFSLDSAPRADIELTVTAQKRIV